jgi:hypothetical protein
MSDKSNKPKGERIGCWRCGSQDVDLFNRLTRMVGNYHARLCADCMNDWEVHMRAHPLFLELRDAEMDSAIAMNQICADGHPRRNLIKDLRSKELSILERLFAIAETWTDDVIDRPAPPPPPPPTEEELAEAKARRRKRLEWQLAQLDAAVAEPQAK